MEAERTLRHRLFDVSAKRCGWYITSRPPMQDGRMAADRHIEVKGCVKEAATVTVSRNEILYGLNQADKFILAIVLVDGEDYEGPHYIRNPFQHGPVFGVGSINYDLSDRLSRAHFSGQDFVSLVVPECPLEMETARFGRFAFSEGVDAESIETAFLLVYDAQERCRTSLRIGNPVTAGGRLRGAVRLEG